MPATESAAVREDGPGTGMTFMLFAAPPFLTKNGARI